MARKRIVPVGLALAVALMASQVLAQVNNFSASVDIDATKKLPIVPSFSGFNYGNNSTVQDQADVTELGKLTARLNPRWLRYPGGSESAAFDWTTGLIPSPMLMQWFNPDGSNKKYDELEGFQDVFQTLAANGIPHTVDRFWSFASGAGAQGLIVCVNGFTDSFASAGNFALYAKGNSIPVLAWELSNEPYLYPQFFADASDYATKMQPYAQAILAQEPQALISLFIDRRDAAWLSGPTGSLISYATQYGAYWNALTVHDYNDCNGSQVPLAQRCGKLLSKRMAFYNEYLTAGLAPYYSSLESLPSLGSLPIVVSEYDPGLPRTDPFKDSLYDGIYVAEYALRLSTQSNVHYVGIHALTDTGIDPSAPTSSPVICGPGVTHCDGPPTVTAKIKAVGIANLALGFVSEVEATTLTGGSSAPATSGTVPALFAQAYEESDGRQHLVVTNKSAATNSLKIFVDGVRLTATLSITEVTSLDPSSPSVTIQSSTESAVVPIPPYSVVHISWAPGT